VLPLICYVPCALHIRLDITKFTLAQILHQLININQLDEFLSVLGRHELQPQFLITLKNKIKNKTKDSFSSAFIKLIGADCDYLEAHFATALEVFKQASKTDLLTQRLIIRCQLLWEHWLYI